MYKTAYRPCGKGGDAERERIEGKRRRGNEKRGYGDESAWAREAEEDARGRAEEGDKGGVSGREEGRRRGMEGVRLDHIHVCILGLTRSFYDWSGRSRVKRNRVQCIRTAIPKAISKVNPKVIAKQVRSSPAISKDF